MRKIDILNFNARNEAQVDLAPETSVIFKRLTRKELEEIGKKIFNGDVLASTELRNSNNSQENGRTAEIPVHNDYSAMIQESEKATHYEIGF